MSKSIVNIADVELKPRPTSQLPKGPAADRFDARIGMIGTQIGAQKIGCNITSVPPGKRAFPLHNHLVNEEMFFILNGKGEVRIGQNRYPIREGDVIACPPGGKETAHQIVNTGDAELRFLAISTKISPDISEYPDSAKFGVSGEFPAGADGTPQVFRFVGRESSNIDYWDKE